MAAIIEREERRKAKRYAKNYRPPLADNGVALISNKYSQRAQQIKAPKNFSQKFADLNAFQIIKHLNQLFCANFYSFE